MAIQFGPDLLLLDRLASGGMADVYRAKYLGKAGFQKNVAVKRILPHFASRQDFKVMFQREMNLCANMQHPNIAQVYANGEHAGYLYLIMEFVDGKNLSDLILQPTEKINRVPLEMACYIVSEIAKGLEYAHSMTDEITGKSLEVIHRDVSPQNIMLGYNGDVKLVDFGIAKAADRFDLTKMGDLKGKVPYSSPENIDGLKLDNRSDIFSLGVVLYEILTNKLLFEGQSTFEVIKNVRESRIPSLSESIPDVPPMLEEIVKRALERDRDQRYQRAQELHQDLSLFLNRHFTRFIPAHFTDFMKRTFADEIEKSGKERRAISAGLASGAIVPMQEGQSSVWQDASGAVDHVAGTTSSGRSGSLRGSGLSSSIPGNSTVDTHTIQVKKRMRPMHVLFAIFLGMNFALFAMISRSKEQKIAVPAVSPVAAVFAFRADKAQTFADRSVSTLEEAQFSRISALQPDPAKQPKLNEGVLNGHAVLSFDGVNDYFIADPIALGMKRFKTSTVIYVARTRGDTEQYIVSAQASDREANVFKAGFTQGKLSRIKINSGTPYFDSSTPSTIEQFSIYSLVIDQFKVSLYRDGLEVIAKGLARGVNFNEATYFSIGQEWEAGQSAKFFNGELAELQIYDRVLSAAERSLAEKALGDKYKVNINQ